MRVDRRPLPFILLAALCLACTCSEEAASTGPGAGEEAPGPVRPAAPEPAGFAPRETGTRALAHFRGAGFAYAAVVTGVGTDGRIQVVYADGDTEAVSEESLYPDTIAPGMRVEARIRTWRQWFPGEVQRRVGHAVFVRFDDGDEQWTSIGLVRVPIGDVSRDAPVAPVAPPTVPVPQPGSRVVANYRGEGWYYPAVVAETRDDGQVHVIYADGDSEWRPTSDVRADPVATGADVQARPARQAQVQEGEVVRRVGHAVELQLEGGAKQWVALSNVRVR